MIRQDRRASPEAVQAMFDAHRLVQEALDLLGLHGDDTYGESVALSGAARSLLDAAWELRARNAGK